MDKRNIFVLVGGMLFGLGLAFSGMTKPEVVLSFLQLSDLGLLLVLTSAILVTSSVYQISPLIFKKSLLGGDFGTQPFNPRFKTILGAIIFGVGWGISGVCPGAALASLGAGNYLILFSIFSIFIGAYAHGRFFGK